MRESKIQTTINRFLTWLAKKSVTALYRRTQFWAFSWGLDDNTDLYLMSEESYPDYHRFGVSEEKYADTPQTEINKTIPLNEWLPFKEYVLEMDGEGKPLSFRIIPMSEYKLQNQEPQTDCGWK